MEVDNVETQAETEFYMDEAGPDMRFAPVSYTPLDVYKRQLYPHTGSV